MVFTAYVLVKVSLSGDQRASRSSTSDDDEGRPARSGPLIPALAIRRLMWPVADLMF